MNAIELFRADGTPTGIYHCEKCRIVHRTKQFADKCCAPLLCACGAGCPQYYTACDECRRKKYVEKERARFEAAEKVTEWSGAVFSDGYGLNEGYFSSVADFLDYWASEHDEEELPEYVWTCDSHSFCQLNYDHIIENATQESYDDWDRDEIEGAEALKAAIETFNEVNKHHVSWEPNFKRALLLKP
jgi:hypothetical protein